MQAELLLDRQPPAVAEARLGEPLHLETLWAQTAHDVQAAQRLRYRVFVHEMGARLSVPPGTPPELDVDRFDAHCEHLVVRARSAQARQADVVGTYRMLTPAGAQRAGGLYTDTEFDLAPLAALLPQTVELGRSCIDERHRSGAVILALWGSLAGFMHRNGLRWMIGCASVPMRDGGHSAASLWHRLSQRHLVAPQYRVQPRLPLPVQDLRQDLPVEPPPLVKGYLRCGAKLLGPPAWDPDFGTADLPLMLDLDEMAPAYRRHFLG